jgi:NADH-quinone oxidoreductase subunit E
MAIDISNVDTIIARHGIEQKGLINALLEIQDVFHYLPAEALKHVSEKMNIPLVQIYQIAAFYKVFSLEPRGEHLVSVCLGTACHVRGGGLLIDQVGRVLDIGPGETSADMKFTLEAENCLGCCALGPVMVVDGKYYGNMAISKVERVLNKYMEQEVVAND